MDSLEDLHNVLFEILNDFDVFCRENNIEYSLAYGTLLGAVRHKGFIPWDDDLDVMMTRENYNKFLSLFKNNERYTLQKEQIDYPLYFSKLRKNKTAFIENIRYRKKWTNIHQGIYIDIFPVDKVSKNKIQRLTQSCFSNILISQSLFFRGYQTKSVKKKIFMILAALFYLCKDMMFKFITKFNSKTNFDFYCCFSGDIKKVYINRNCFEKIKKIDFEGKRFSCISEPEKYLESSYGNWNELPSLKEREGKIHAKIFDALKDYKELIK